MTHALPFAQPASRISPPRSRSTRLFFVALAVWLSSAAVFASPPESLPTAEAPAVEPSVAELASESQESFDRLVMLSAGAGTAGAGGVALGAMAGTVGFGGAAFTTAAMITFSKGGRYISQNQVYAMMALAGVCLLFGAASIFIPAVVVAISVLLTDGSGWAAAATAVPTTVAAAGLTLLAAVGVVLTLEFTGNVPGYGWVRIAAGFAAVVTAMLVVVAGTAAVAAFSAVGGVLVGEVTEEVLLEALLAKEATASQE